tara:strand:- start:1587 stop:2255 length:669 start_codon:yes stop_codon:yes gene_type:complete
MAFELNLLSLFIQASLVVKLVLVTLLIISFVSWWFIIEKYITFKRVEKDIYDFNKFFWGKNSLDSIFSKVLNKERLVGIEQIFFVAYKEFKDSKDKGINFESIKKIIEISISRNEEILSKRLSFLSTAASVSPYIGLFGTVWGIMNAFGGLSQLTQVSITVVAPGISEALIATALGLFAAIPALISYNWNLSKINTFINEYSNFSEELIIILAKEIDENERS